MTPAPELVAVVVAEAERAEVPQWLALGLAYAESRWNPEAVSPAGARGLYQLMPKTGEAFGLRSVEDFHDARKNTAAALAYLRHLRRRLPGLPWFKVVAAYNRGPGWLLQHNDPLTWPAELQRWLSAIWSYRDAAKKAEEPGSPVEVVCRDLRTGQPLPSPSGP